MARIKRNDNGPMPDCPNDDTAADRERDAIAAAVELGYPLNPDSVGGSAATERARMRVGAEIAREDAQLRAHQRAKRSGLCENFTKAPWLVK